MHYEHVPDIEEDHSSVPDEDLRHKTVLVGMTGSHVERAHEGCHLWSGKQCTILKRPPYLVWWPPVFTAENWWPSFIFHDGGVEVCKRQFVMVWFINLTNIVLNINLYPSNIRKHLLLAAISKNGCHGRHIDNSRWLLIQLFLEFLWCNVPNFMLLS